MSESKYRDLVFEFVPQETNWGDWCYSPQAYFRGDKDIPGSNYNVGFQIFQAPVYLEREPHFHREEEFLIFLGANVFDFDAEIDFYIGDDIDDMEKFVLTKPTIIRIPPCTWHCPLDFKRVDKPIFFQAALMHGKFGSVKAREGKNGREFVFEGDGLRSCVLEHDKECIYCGTCFKRLNEPEKK